jgi:uncharacterized membrane protein YkvA (DUF1232 family)
MEKPEGFQPKNIHFSRFYRVQLGRRKLMSQTPNNYLNPSFWRGLWQDAQLAWNLFRDPRVPTYMKGVPLLAVLYVISPFDLIPGIIPILGQLDDLALLVLGVKVFLNLIPEELVREHRQRMGLPQG